MPNSNLCKILACLFLMLNASFGVDYREILITDGFGIVTEEDITHSKKLVVPRCWSFNEKCPTQYWQCFSSKNFESSCVLSGELDSGESSYLPTAYIKHDHALQELIVRRPDTKENCEGDVAKWNAIVNSEAVFCISAAFISKENNGNSLWLMDHLKNHLGRWSYFLE